MFYSGQTCILLSCTNAVDSVNKILECQLHAQSYKKRTENFIGHVDLYNQTSKVPEEITPICTQAQVNSQSFSQTEPQHTKLLDCCVW